MQYCKHTTDEHILHPTDDHHSSLCAPNQTFRIQLDLMRSKSLILILAIVCSDKTVCETFHWLKDNCVYFCFGTEKKQVELTQTDLFGEVERKRLHLSVLLDVCAPLSLSLLVLSIILYSHPPNYRNSIFDPHQMTWSFIYVSCGMLQPSGNLVKWDIQLVFHGCKDQ